MKVVSDGKVSITLQYEHATVRMVDHVADGDHPPFVGVGQITRLPNNVALLHGFCGTISMAHCWLLLQALIADGFTTVYASRLEGHIAPQAELIESGDFAGMWRINLLDVKERRRRPTPVEVRG